MTIPTDFTTGDFLGAILLVVGTVALAVLVLASVRRKYAKRREATPTARERIASVRQTATLREDAHAINARMLDTAQHLAAQLDAKAARLDQLLDQADLRLSQLRAATRAPVGDPPPTPRVEPFTPTPPAMAPPPPIAPAPAPDPLTAAVYDMADQGQPPLEIARALDEQIGKVELILALRAPGR